MATRFKRLVLNPRESVVGFHLTQVQDNISLSLLQIQNSEFQNGVFVEVSLLSASDNVVNHGLGRVVQGWTVIRKDARADVWDSSATNNFPDKQIILSASANVKVKLYLF